MARWSRDGREDRGQDARTRWAVGEFRVMYPAIECGHGDHHKRKPGSVSLPPLHRAVAEALVRVEDFLQHAGVALGAYLEHQRVGSR